MFTLSKKSNYPLGIDISDLSLKLIQLNKIRGKIKIQAISSRKLLEGTIQDGEIINSTNFNQELKKLISKPEFGNIGSNDVSACLPDSKTYIKLIKVEKSINPISDIIANEIQKNIPLLENDMYYDWQLISEEKNNFNILIGAAKKSIVDSYIENLSQAGLNVVSLEPEPVAVVRALLKEESPSKVNLENKNYGIIDIGAKRTNIVFYSNNSIVSSISLPISGNEITQKISKTLEINMEQAEKAKIICGLDKNKAKGIIDDILKDMIKELIEKIKESIDFYETNYPNLGLLNSLILCGGGANIKNLDKEIEENIGIKTSLGNFKEKIDETSEKLEKYFITTIKSEKDKENNELNKKIQKDLAPGYTSAMGLALKGIYLEE